MRGRGWGLLGVAIGILCAASAATGAPSPTSVHFTAAGDYGQNAATTGEVIKTIAAADPDLHVALGDLSYGVVGQEQSWCDFVKQRTGEGFPFELLSGNHESNGINGNINDFSACLPNQLPGVVGTYGREWYVDVPQTDPLVRFVNISPGLTYPDSKWTYTAGDAHYNWAVNAIDSARSKGVPWVVVAMHKPCLSVGEYTCDPGPDVVNMLLAKKVDLVLMGHEHDYERTKQLALGPGCATLAIGTYDADCVRDSDNDLVARAGTVFMTIGTGGQSMRDVNTADTEYPYMAATMGLNQNRTFGVGDFQVTPDKISVSFLRAPNATGSGTFSDAFTITRQPDAPNTPPVAAFTATTSDLTATFDSSGSGDTDGIVTSYAWTFGDGTTSTLANPSKTWSAAGTYPVTLTVTDDDGASTSTTKDVTVTAATGPPVIASDAFGRTVTGGWGTADLGGAWTVDGTASRYSVSAGTGRITLPAGNTLTARLAGLSTTRSQVTADFSTNKLADALYATVIGRQVGPDQYAARLRLQADGGARLFLLQNGNALASSAVIPGLTITPDARYRMVLETVGTSPTRLSAKVWKVGDPEPSAWRLTTTNSFAALQTAGHVGLSDYLPSAATAVAPVTVSWDDLKVVQPAP